MPKPPSQPPRRAAPRDPSDPRHDLRDQFGGTPPRLWLHNWLTRWWGDLPDAREEVSDFLRFYDRSPTLQRWATGSPFEQELFVWAIATMVEAEAELTWRYARRSIGDEFFGHRSRGRPRSRRVRLMLALESVLSYVYAPIKQRRRVIAALIHDLTERPCTADDVHREILRDRSEPRRPPPCAGNPIPPLYVATVPGAWLVDHGLLKPVVPHAACARYVPVIAYACCVRTKGPGGARVRSALAADCEAQGVVLVPMRP